MQKTINVVLPKKRLNTWVTLSLSKESKLALKNRKNDSLASSNLYQGSLVFSGTHKILLEIYPQLWHHQQTLDNMLKIDRFKWTEKEERAFELLKEVMTEAPILRLPDFSKQFILEAYACGAGTAIYKIKGCLYQQSSLRYKLLCISAKISAKEIKGCWFMRRSCCSSYM